MKKTFLAIALAIGAAFAADAQTPVITAPPQIVATIPVATYSGTAGIGATTLYTPTSQSLFRFCEWHVMTVAGTAGTFISYINFTVAGHLISGRQIGSAVNANTQWQDSNNFVGVSCTNLIADAGTQIIWSLQASGVTGSPTVLYGATLERLK